VATSFAQLVQEKYVRRGVTPSTALQLVHIGAGIALNTAWEAYRGRCVAPKTAKRLREWAFVEHGVEDLDIEALVFGPPQRRSVQR
jgi:hypothetical protein